MTWQIVSPGKFYNCGENTVIYFHPESGNTHLLSAFAGHLLQHLAPQPQDIDQLVEKCASAIPPAELPQLNAVITHLMTELVELDIVTPT